MGFMDFTCGIVHYARKFITYPVDKQLLTGFSLLREYDVFTGFILPVIVLCTETTVTVTIRVFFPVFFLPDILEIDTSAGE